MHRPDGPGIAVVSHARDLAELRLPEDAVGDYDPQSGVAGEEVGRVAHVVHQLLNGAGQAFPVRRQQTRHRPSIRPADVSQRVHRHQSAYPDVPGLHRKGAEAGFHGPCRALVLADGAAGAGTFVALRGRVIGGVFAGGIGHGGVRPHVLAAHAEIEQTALRHQRDLGEAHVEADVTLLQIPLHAPCRVETEGAAAGQKHRVDPLRRHQRIQDLGLPGGGTAAPDVQSRGTHPVAEEHRAAGGSLPVLGMAHPEAADLHDPDLFHIASAPFTA